MKWVKALSLPRNSKRLVRGAAEESNEPQPSDAYRRTTIGFSKR